MNEVIIYTDGACSNNPGPGGYAAILMSEGKTKKISGAEKLTTNNKMELTAVIKGLEALKKPCKVELYSDSAYVVNCFKQGWLEKWQQNNWKTASKEPVKNKELWEKLYELTQIHDIKWVKVKGHAENKYNNMCDEMAREEIANIE